MTQKMYHVFATAIGPDSGAAVEIGKASTAEDAVKVALNAGYELADTAERSCYFVEDSGTASIVLRYQNDGLGAISVIVYPHDEAQKNKVKVLMARRDRNANAEA